MIELTVTHPLTHDDLDAVARLCSSVHPKRAMRISSEPVIENGFWGWLTWFFRPRTYVLKYWIHE